MNTDATVQKLIAIIDDQLFAHPKRLEGLPDEPSYVVAIRVAPTPAREVCSGVANAYLEAGWKDVRVTRILGTPSLVVARFYE